MSMPSVVASCLFPEPNWSVSPTGYKCCLYWWMLEPTGTTHMVWRPSSYFLCCKSIPDNNLQHKHKTNHHKEDLTKFVVWQFKKRKERYLIAWLINREHEFLCFVKNSLQCGKWRVEFIEINWRKLHQKILYNITKINHLFNDFKCRIPE